MSAREQLWRALGAGGAGMMSAAGYPARLTILIYHSIGPSPDPLGYWDATAAEFEHKVQVLKRAFNVIRLRDAVRHLADGTLPPRAACITFDDGYADNYTVALPILQRYGLSATFFVASGYLGGGQMFNDVASEAIRRCSAERLDLEDLGLGVFPLDTLAARIAARHRILEQLKPMALEQRDLTAAAVARAAGISPQANLMMTRAQLAALARSGMDIGGHTHRHPILSSVSDEDVREELTVCKNELEAITDGPVDLFAYPNGKPGRDYAFRHAQMVRNAGFTAAVSTAHGAATYGADPFQLPRFTPWDRSAEKFIVRLLLNWRADYQVAQ